MRHVPVPLEWHPAYARDVHVLLPFLDGSRPADVVLIPRREHLNVAELLDGADVVTSIGMRHHTLTPARLAGPAPYVGEPFVYSWWALVDELGRAVAGDSRIVHHRPESWIYAPGGAWPDPYVVPMLDEGGPA